MAAAFLTFLLPAAMIGIPVAQSTFTYDKQRKQISDDIDSTNKEIERIQNSFKDMINQSNRTGQDIANNINETTTLLQEYKRKITLSRQLYARHYKNLQLFGILIFSLVTFLLIMKFFKIF